MTDLIIDTFALAYVEAALWSSTDEDGEPLDGLYTIDDIHPDTLAVMVKDCDDFQSFAGPFIADREEQAGHDFWLTRNGHGAGFWDRGLGTVGDILTSMCRPYGEYTLYLGDDGKIYGM